MEINTAELVFWAVVLSRLFVPLLIPRFPLPAIIACLVIDAVDQTVFQAIAPDADLTGYQSYDKALDIYYLVIAYIATLRNWTNQFAVSIARFLIFWRLVGVVFFELGVPLPPVLEEILGERGWLFIFPNVFEYFFIFFEAVRVLWDPRRMSRGLLLGAAAFIWIFIKLPQEWWLHIAQNDFTDFMKEDVFGVSVTTSWATAIGENLWFVGLMAVVGVGVGLREISRRAPAADWSFNMDVDKTIGRAQSAAGSVERPAVVSWYMFEKIALVSMVTIIFAQVLPGNDTDLLGTVVAVSFVIVVNSFVGFWFARRGRSWATTAGEFAMMAFVNIVSALVFIALSRNADEPLNEAATLFFVLLLTLIVTMFDRYHRSIPQVSVGPRSVQKSAATS